MSYKSRPAGPKCAESYHETNMNFVLVWLENHMSHRGIRLEAGLPDCLGSWRQETDRPSSHDAWCFLRVRHV